VPERRLAIEELLTLLTEAPPRLAASTALLSPAQLRTRPKNEGWSANDVLSHVRACADVWGGCIEAIIAEDRPTLRAVNPRTWIKRTDYRELEFRSSLRSFTKQRSVLLAALEPLPPKSWSRSATVTGAGAVLVRTVHFYVQWLAKHERTHVKQIARIANEMQ
jgi:uncharacterized damage-inducible protein DinB